MVFPTLDPFKTLHSLKAAARRATLATGAATLVAALLATAAFADGDPTRPERGGTALNPYWIYGAAAILAENPSAGALSGPTLRVTKAEHSGFLNGPVLKLCQPLFNGQGSTTTDLHVLARLTDAGKSAVEPVLYVELSATSNVNGAKIVDIRTYGPNDLIDGEFFNVASSIEIPGGATNVCLSVRTYPVSVLPAGGTNPYLRELWISSARLAMNANPQ